MKHTAMKSDLMFRAAGPGDAAFAAAVDTAVRPSAPRDPLTYEYWWAQPDENWEFARFVVTRGDARVGYATAEHPRWEMQPDRMGASAAISFPRTVPPELDAIYAAMEYASAPTERRSWRVTNETTLSDSTLHGRGYKEDRRSRRWELDLVANREMLLAMTEESRSRMQNQGVRMLTLATDDDPKVIEKIWRLSEEAGDDVPTTEPRVPEEMASYARWVNAPEIHRDRF